MYLLSTSHSWYLETSTFDRKIRIGHEKYGTIQEFMKKVWDLDVEIPWIRKHVAKYREDVEALLNRKTVRIIGRIYDPRMFIYDRN